MNNEQVWNCRDEPLLGALQLNGWSILKLKVENHDSLKWISLQFKCICLPNLVTSIAKHAVALILTTAVQQ